MYEELLMLVALAAVVLSIPLTWGADADAKDRWKAFQDEQAERREREEERRRNATGRPFNRVGSPREISWERSGGFGSRFPRSQTDLDSAHKEASDAGVSSVVIGPFGRRTPGPLD